ncbi:hypothetical protein [Pedobacter nyackensis]|uniref:Uncharacterized protein n=1 Tax=Pedobacter nyackensis TaxID=475255 RepID=A0A1W2AJ64_9SPHI|nr:hypothetical protein [Pedobacter nyackensis]SMC60600.1 hypothetical protein SAMN04488101_101650 [Pedobacter nyackensis]
MAQQNRLEYNHQKLHEFIKRYSFGNGLHGKYSPRSLKGARISIFVLYIIFSGAFVTTTYLKAKPWNIMSGIATIIVAIIMIWIYRKTLKLIQQGFHSIIFKKRFELEQYIKNDLKLGKTAVQETAEICLILADRYKRNYYRLELPLAIIPIFVAILAIVKDISLEDMASLVISFALVVFGIWYLLVNIITSLDQQSNRYFELYLLLVDMKHNKQYQKLKKEHLRATSERNELEEALS